jgi:hypothetical protein
MRRVRLDAELTLAFVARNFHYFFFPRAASSLSTLAANPCSALRRCR